MIYSVGVIEIKSIAYGIQATDDALKSAGVTLISAQSLCPGKFEIVLTGELASVDAALELVRKNYRTQIIDSILLGKIDQSVVHALLYGGNSSPSGALGTIETYSAASAILAADTAVKCANVDIWELRVARGMGGKGLVLFTGGVAEVTAAVAAGSSYAKTEGLFVASSVVGAPHESLWQYV